MCAADMCEGVLDHARGYFASTTHVLSPAPPARPGAAAANGRSCGDSAPPAASLMVVGDSRLACAAREARALHGMLVTIHEVGSVVFVAVHLALFSRDAVAVEAQEGGGEARSRRW